MNGNRKTVSVVRCEEYGKNNAYTSVKQSLDNLGGLDRFIAPGSKVFLKFNMLLGSPPETCITTHPDVVYAVARLLKEHGCNVIMGDSPGSGLAYNENVLRDAYAISGYDKVAEDLDIPLNYDVGYERVPAPEAKPMKHFSIIKPALWADDIVVVSKAKTHTLTLFSGATKNLFGIIPGLDKPTYHANFQNADDFGRMILYINELIPPKLQIMDAIMAMEGDGPHSGTPRKIGAVLASGDHNAIDVATARLMSFDPLAIPTIRAAVDKGFLLRDFSDVTIVGEPIEELTVRDFKGPSTYDENGMKRFISSIRPRILDEMCIGCMKCLGSCPVKAITAVKKKPLIDYEKCIRCYCCHEMCDNHAIELERVMKGPA